MRVQVISLSWGLPQKIPAIELAIKQAIGKGIVVVASASNEGARNPITFPATMDKVFCIGSADGDGFLSTFSPPETDRLEKFSAVGEGIVAAFTTYVKDGSPEPQRRIRQDGTSIAAAGAAAVAALLLDYLRQFKGREVEDFHHMRKLFINMSASTAGHDYQFLAPWYLFPESDPQAYISEILRKPAGTQSLVMA
jgi:subtilisin family serine protease